MLPTSNYQFRILGGGHLWLPTHVPQGFHKDDRATWPPNAFLLPHDLEPEEKLAFLRQRLERKEFVEYCTIELLPDKWPEDIREEAAAVLALTRATTCFVDSEAASEGAAKISTVAEALSAQREAAQREVAEAAQADRQQRTDRAREKARDTAERERKRAQALCRFVAPKSLELPLPQPPVIPQALAELRDAIRTRGPETDSIALRANSDDTQKTFKVDKRFRNFKGTELNFLVWAEFSRPIEDKKPGSWLLKLLQIEPGNKFARTSGADFADTWEPSWAAARLLECTEARLNAICRETCGKNARELWDFVRIRHAGVLEMFEYELRLLRHEGYTGEAQGRGLEGVQAEMRRARRFTGRLRSTLAKRLGFLNNARLDRAFYHALGQSLSELEAELLQALAAEGSLDQQLERYHAKLAEKLAQSDAPASLKTRPDQVAYKVRSRRTRCRDLKKLVHSDFAAHAKASWYKRRIDKLDQILDAVPPLEDRTDSSLPRVVGATGGWSASAGSSPHVVDAVPPLGIDSDPSLPRVVGATGGLSASAGSSPPVVDVVSSRRDEANAAHFTPAALERLRWQRDHEFRYARTEWNNLAADLRKMLREREPGPSFGKLPPERRPPADIPKRNAAAKSRKPRKNAGKDFEMQREGKGAKLPA